MYNMFYTQVASRSHCTVKNISHIEKIVGEFTPICQRYTDVMAHKYYLQHHLFHRTNDATVMMKLTSVIISLQAIANSFQITQVRCRRVYTCTINYINCAYTFQVNQNDVTPCVTFTPCQYMKIYYSRLPLSSNSSPVGLDALCLLQMGARKWQDKTC